MYQRQVRAFEIFFEVLTLMYMYIVVLSLTNIKSNQYCILETKKYGDRNRVLTKLIATLPGGGFSTLDPDVFQSFFFKLAQTILIYCIAIFVLFGFC